MLLRDRLLARLRDAGARPDYSLIASEVLGIRNAPPALARRLVEQALVLEDRREAWRRTGEQIVARAPATPGVYVLRDAQGAAIYVGKANNLRRRLGAHFAPRRWRAIGADMAQAAGAEWQEVGSELEALIREAEWIAELAPPVNVQIGPPNPEGRDTPVTLVRDVVVLVPSIEPDSVELVGARADGGVMIQRTRRNGADLRVHAARVWKFRNRRLTAGDRGGALAPIVYSWLHGRGESATRIDLGDITSARDLERRLAAALGDRGLFVERIVVLHSKFRSARTRRKRAEPGSPRPRP